LRALAAAREERPARRDAFEHIAQLGAVRREDAVRLTEGGAVAGAAGRDAAGDPAALEHGVRVLAGIAAGREPMAALVERHAFGAAFVVDGFLVAAADVILGAAEISVERRGAAEIARPATCLRGRVLAGLQIIVGARLADTGLLADRSGG